MAVSLRSATWRSAASLTTPIVKASVRHTIAIPPTLQYRALSAASRGFAASTSQSRDPLAPCLSTLRTSYKSQQHIRWNSSESGPLFRQWGFEDINASLPSSTPSPSHTPVIFIDVREPAELTSTGIIPTAINIPLGSQGDALYLTEDEFETRFGFPKPKVESDQQIVFYCKAGVRARAAAQMAVQAGYNPDRVGVYQGSWLDWEKKGGKTERWDGGHA